MDRKEALVAILEESDAVPEEYRPLMTGVIQGADEDILTTILVDAVRAKTLMAEGKRDEARDIIEGYRYLAEAAGFGALFQAMLGEFLD